MIAAPEAHCVLKSQQLLVNAEKPTPQLQTNFCPLSFPTKFPIVFNFFTCHMAQTNAFACFIRILIVFLHVLSLSRKGVQSRNLFLLCVQPNQIRARLNPTPFRA
ncbi:hypothetical protein CW304_13340 [Bacillus sp. UFRGS-B20]|nr:hypothetical protein CW304_13340 [Bacillus sp. UFRGS-B20]